MANTYKNNNNKNNKRIRTILNQSPRKTCGMLMMEWDCHNFRNPRFETRRGENRTILASITIIVKHSFYKNSIVQVCCSLRDAKIRNYNGIRQKVTKHTVQLIYTRRRPVAKRRDCGRELCEWNFCNRLFPKQNFVSLHHTIIWRKAAFVDRSGLFTVGPLDFEDLQRYT